MDYRHLKYFMEVAQQKSFSKAARSLHISQSAISRMIKSLEDEMGVTLFLRNAKTVELTAPGTMPSGHCLYLNTSNLTSKMNSILSRTRWKSDFRQ